MCNLCEGRISATPPTSVETQCKPKRAASTKATPNDYVSAVLRKMWQLLTISKVRLFESPPCSNTLS